MTVTCVVQARMGSTRLPGKVLADVGGEPMLALMLRRLRLLGRSGVELVVATSSSPSDDSIAELASALGTAVARGSEQDVLDRFRVAISEHPAEVIVRLTADCPLIDPVLVLDVIDAHARTGADYTSNTLVRTFPDGLDVEVVTARALAEASAEAAASAEREHVTPFIYRRPGRFLLHQHTTDAGAGRERWTIDREDDLAWLRATVGRLPDATSASWTEILGIVGRRAPDDDLHLVPVAVPARPRGPFERRWDVRDGQRSLGPIAIAVSDGGTAALITPLPDQRTAEIVAALRNTLAADLQVVDLDVDA